MADGPDVPQASCSASACRCNNCCITSHLTFDSHTFNAQGVGHIAHAHRHVAQNGWQLKIAQQVDLQPDSQPATHTAHCTSLQIRSLLDIWGQMLARALFRARKLELS